MKEDTLVKGIGDSNLFGEHLSSSFLPDSLERSILELDMNRFPEKRDSNDLLFATDDVMNRKVEVEKAIFIIKSKKTEET